MVILRRALLVVGLAVGGLSDSMIRNQTEVHLPDDFGGFVEDDA
tara:strand:+ start:2680 stop:2811 length:132 start_codon:yes stop_codon:yes gene_type:complete